MSHDEFDDYLRSATTIPADLERQLLLQKIDAEIASYRLRRTGLPLWYPEEPPVKFRRKDGKFRRLNPAQKTLLKRYQEGLAAREALTDGNRLRVVGQVKAYRRMYGDPPQFDTPEMISCGHSGLLRGIDKFRFGKKSKKKQDHGNNNGERTATKLSTYVTWWVRQGVQRSAKEQWKRLRRELNFSDLEPEIPSGDGENSSLGGSIVQKDDNGRLDPARVAGEYEMANVLAKRVDARSALILILRYGLPVKPDLLQKLIRGAQAMQAEGAEDTGRYLRLEMIRPGHFTLEEIGNMFGITRERIRQLETKAKNKVAKAFNYLLPD